MSDQTNENGIIAFHEKSISVEGSVQRLPGVIQWWLCIYAFFLAFPALSIVGINITFFIFFLILIIHGKNQIPIITRDKTNKWFILLFLTGTVSTLFHPQLDIEVSILEDIKTISQYFYWILLAMYIRSNFYLIDWWRFSRSLFWGLVALVAGFYFIPIKVDLAILVINFDSSRNGFIYTLLCLFPMVFWYLRYSTLKRISPVILVLLIMSIIISNGRAGFILIVIQSLLIGFLIYPSFGRLFKIGLIALMVLFVVWQINPVSKLNLTIAQTIKKINPRTSAMITKEGTEGNLATDKSWLLRKLMVDKTVEIVKEYPLLGIGWMHFEKYYAKLKTLDKYERLSSQSNEYLNTRSSHNSYAMYIAESGIIGFFLLLWILVITLLPFFKKLFRNELSIINLPLIAMITLAIYFYVITSITGANTWFLIGASLGCVRNFNNELWE